MSVVPERTAEMALDGGANDFHADEAKHSKSHHQQYSDFIRSGMYKNATELMTCTGCHDPHERNNIRQLRAALDDEDAMCGGACHGAEVEDKRSHIDNAMGMSLGLPMRTAACVECHMAKTAKTGAGEPGISIDDTQYWKNDISSHLFDVPAKVASLKGSPGVDMTTPYTDRCGKACHTELP
jgi:predicted CXXCH cytochrome family protein